MERNKIKNEIDGVLDFYMYENCLSKEEASIPTAEIYLYMYLDGAIEAKDLLDVLDGLRFKNLQN